MVGMVVGFSRKLAVLLCDCFFAGEAAVCRTGKGPILGSSDTFAIPWGELEEGCEGQRQSRRARDCKWRGWGSQRNEDSVPKYEPEPNEHKDRLIDRANLRVDKDVQFLLR